MPTVTLVPTSLTDTNSNVFSGSYTDIDETIASADGNSIISTTNEWGPSAGSGSAFSFGMSDLPAEASSINTVQFRARARVVGGDPDADLLDIATWVFEISGDNAPTTKPTWRSLNSGAGYSNRGASSGVSSSATVAEVNAWTVIVYQSSFSQVSTADGMYLEIDCIEIIVDYNNEPVDPPSEPPAGGGYTVLPTTDTSIYGLCIAQARDFVVLGGLDTDRYGIRWSALGDPTDWPVPATDDARSKQAGSQTFPTKFGWVTGITGDDFTMFIFQESAIHRATYVGGDIVWSFDTIDTSRGCIRQGRLVKIGNATVFQSNFGYHLIQDGSIVDIGYGVVDDTFN